MQTSRGKIKAYAPIISVLDKITGKTAIEAMPIVREHFLNLFPATTVEQAILNTTKAFKDIAPPKQEVDKEVI